MVDKDARSPRPAAKLDRTAVARNLKALRLISEKSLAEAAGTAGKSESFLSLVESGKRAIAPDDLIKLLKAYGFTFISFINSFTEEIAGQAGIAAGIELWSAHGGNTVLIYDLDNSVAGGLTALNGRVAPGECIPGDFIEAGDEISVEATEGKLLVEMKDDEATLRPGEKYIIHPGISFKLRNYSATSCSFRILTTGGGF